MGTSAFVLFKSGSSVRIPQLLSTTEQICEENNLYYSGFDSGYGDPNETDYCEININDILWGEEGSSERDILFGLANEPYEFRNIDFAWDSTGQEYFAAMIAIDFYNSEDLLFKFLHPFLQRYPEAKLWIDNDWFYTLEDMEKIANKQPFVQMWCFKDPKTFC